MEKLFICLLVGLVMPPHNTGTTKGTHGDNMNGTNVTINKTIFTGSYDPVKMKVQFCEEVIKIPMTNCSCNKSQKVCDYDNNKFIPESTEQYCSYLFIPKNECSCEHREQICRFGRFLKGEPEPLTIFREYDEAAAAITTIALILGIVGNSAVLLVSFRRRANLPKNKVMITLLALTDGIACILNWFRTGYKLWQDDWPYGQPLCKMIHTGMYACSWFSIGFIFTISIERFFGIIYPTRLHLRSKKVVYGCAAVTAVIAFAAGLPLMIATNVDEKINRCNTSADWIVPYDWTLLIVFMIIPVCCVSFFYSAIIVNLINQTRNSFALSRDDLRKRRVEENRRTVMILIPIVVAFVACVLPMNAIDVYFATWKHDMDFDLYLVLVLIQNICFPLHACVNPLIYTIADRNFRNDLLSMLKLQRKTEQQSNMSQKKSISVDTVCTSI